MSLLGRGHILAVPIFIAPSGDSPTPRILLYCSPCTCGRTHRFAQTLLPPALDIYLQLAGCNSTIDITINKETATKRNNTVSDFMQI